MSDEQPAETGTPVYAIAYPPAMYAREILTDRAFASALGYGWLHEEDTEFSRCFRAQVSRQAEIYQQWLEADEAPSSAPDDNLSNSLNEGRNRV